MKSTTSSPAVLISETNLQQFMKPFNRKFQKEFPKFPGRIRPLFESDSSTPGNDRKRKGPKGKP
jgi:hypothetical protein